MADPKAKAVPPQEASPNGKPQAPAPKGPAPQQATGQQKGQPQAGQRPTPGAPGPTSGPGPQGPPPGPGGPKGGKGQPPEGPPPLPTGPSPELSKAYEFLRNYVMQGMGGLPADMLNGGDPDQMSPLNNLGQALPTTITGDLKTFPKYSLATGAPNTPGLPTGLTPSPLVGGLPRNQVAVQQLKMQQG